MRRRKTGTEILSILWARLRLRIPAARRAGANRNSVVVVQSEEGRETTISHSV
jgi:hypothetical protein